MASLTGGELNKLNGRAGVSAPQNSVPVMALVRHHRPQSADELVELIASHMTPGCPCGVVSKGTVEQFGRNLFDAQRVYWHEERFTLEECLTWEYHLFVTQVLKGESREHQGCCGLQLALGDEFLVEHVDAYIDQEFRVDLTVSRDARLLCGVQVKPSSYDHVREGVKHRNHQSNEQFGAPVLYLTYHSDSGAFLNLAAVAQEVRGLP